MICRVYNRKLFSHQKHSLSIFEQEPRVQQSIKDGVDIVMFSGDKLFGSAVVIAGKDELINSIKTSASSELTDAQI